MVDMTTVNTSSVNTSQPAISDAELKELQEKQKKENEKKNIQKIGENLTGSLSGIKPPEKNIDKPKVVGEKPATTQKPAVSKEEAAKKTNTIFGILDKISGGSTGAILNVADKLTLGTLSGVSNIANDLTNGATGNMTAVDKNSIFGGAFNKAAEEIETFASSKKEEAKESDAKDDSFFSMNMLGNLIDNTIGKAVKETKNFLTGTSDKTAQSAQPKDVKSMSKDEIAKELDNFDSNQPNAAERYAQLCEANGSGPAAAADTHKQAEAMKKQTQTLGKLDIGNMSVEDLQKLAGTMGAQN